MRSLKSLLMVVGRADFGQLLHVMQNQKKMKRKRCHQRRGSDCFE